ncbi:MAG: hypothetical protein J2P25_23200 [Nocardiopsaceae bacterium]|nr:hypothetical protein [Nocardiopsaceae bacterium]
MLEEASQGRNPAGSRPSGRVGRGPDADGRTEALINGGRRNTAPSRLRFFRGHWRATAGVAGALTVLLIIVVATAGGGSGPNAAWPASVTRMQSQIAAACQNPDVAAEPSRVDFACGKGTRQVLWVFALLTSGGNPGYVDQVTGRKGLEPITPTQGGDVAWSLNLHHPYDPANPVDSIEVAARAVNNIIGGATLTGSSGQPSVQSGLESSASNCRRYTGSAELTRRAGYPALCARPLSAHGKQALVSDAFRKWMTGAPAQTATDAGILFAHSADPANPQVRKILNSLPGSSG